MIQGEGHTTVGLPEQGPASGVKYDGYGISQVGQICPPFCKDCRNFVFSGVMGFLDYNDPTSVSLYFSSIGLIQDIPTLKTLRQETRSRVQVQMTGRQGLDTHQA